LIFMIFAIEGDRHQIRINRFDGIEEIRRSFGEPFDLKQIESDKRGSVHEMSILWRD
jgi:hypothetical protein